MNSEQVGFSKAQTEFHPFFYPHGGMMVWLFILLELFTFGVGFCAFLYIRMDEFELFKESQAHLNQKLATINTIILISSGFLLAVANRNYRVLSHKLTGLLTFFSTLLGMMFLYLKYSEYSEKVTANLTTGTNSFYDFYWILTGFHAAHVLLGIFFLLFFSIYFFISGKPLPKENNYDAVVTYWHMCDLIWILLFPIIYLL